MEHVIDIDSIRDEIIRIIKPTGYIFIEVPNALGNINLDNKADNKIPKIHPPHTYYFTKSFFNKWFDKLILNESYFQSHLKNIDNYDKFRHDDGDVIRVIYKI